MATAINVPGVNRLSANQIEAVNDAAAELGIDPDWLFTVISFETGGTFSPTVRNQAGSGAFGLIQFMPSTAQNMLGTSTREAAVAKGMSMTFEEQLRKMVVPYLRGPNYRSLEDVYLKIFYPAAMNKSDDWVIGTAPGAVYTQNRGFDRDGKGYITRGDVVRKIRSLYQNAGGIVSVEQTHGGVILQAVFGTIIGAAAVWFVARKYGLPLPGKVEQIPLPGPLEKLA